MACAPTGSGKTVMFELAIIRLLLETSEPWKDVKAVYSKENKTNQSNRSLTTQIFRPYPYPAPIDMVCMNKSKTEHCFQVTEQNKILL